MINTTLAKRYAKALVAIGTEQNALEKYGQDLANLVQMVEVSKDFRELLVNPVFTKDDKKKITGQILEQTGTDRMVINFVNVLIDRKRIDQLGAIEEAYREEVDKIRGITRGEVTSAETITEEELDRVTEALSTITGKQVLVTTKVDPYLVGGLVARVGDMVFDGTIRTQLNQLKESLKG
ncbi:MAG: ATP synthase F1 subunit delta [Desulfomonile tiedjei]|uniref:ATP synthase subunit delta n=1 Tax=Desulfomonile tiedjei TaxID=2358 RepID=A0A9D6Z270_9BACT|nr:ATP synthase F1 subunit delta [Desulfomonile tiedjei]